MKNSEIQVMIDLLKSVIAKMETAITDEKIIISTDDLIVKAKGYYTNQTGETIHAGHPVNICQCCGNIRKSTTQADNGNYYCQTCKPDATATAYQVRRYCSKCGIKLPSFFDIVGQDLLYCEKCTPAEKGGAGDE